MTGLAFSLSVAIATFPIFGLKVSLFLFFVLGISTLFMWFKAQSSVKLSDDYLIVGRAMIERHWIDDITVLSPTHFVERIRTGALATDYLALRNLEYGGVVIGIADSSDPHQHWVVSMRHGSGLRDQWKRAGNG